MTRWKPKQGIEHCEACNGWVSHGANDGTGEYACRGRLREDPDTSTYGEGYDNGYADALAAAPASPAGLDVERLARALFAIHAYRTLDEASEVARDIAREYAAIASPEARAAALADATAAVKGLPIWRALRLEAPSEVVDHVYATVLAAIRELENR